MSIDWIGSFWGVAFDMLKSMKFGNLVDLLSSSRRFDRVCQDWFVWDFVEGLFQRQASRRSVKGFGSLLVPLLALCSKSTSLSAGFSFVSPGCRLWLVFGCVLSSWSYSLVILSLPLLGVGSKSTSLSPAFCVRRPKQYDMICWDFFFFSGFFVSSW